MTPKIDPKAKEKSRVTKEEWRAYTKTVWSIANTSHSEHPAVFPEEIPSRLIKLFSFWGEAVLDPFGGTGTTALAALALGRKAICVDQNGKYCSIMKEECEKRFPAESGNGQLQVKNDDSRKLDWLDDESVGLIITSPPYWNKADYGKGKPNLGNVPNYRSFFDEIRPVFAECLRVLQPGRKFCVVTANVNQHTNHGLLSFPLATDFTILARDVGFVLVNDVIWSKDGTGGKWGSYGKQRPIFGSYPFPPNFLFKTVHEHILIFARPPKTQTKGPKVIPYEQLMSNDGKLEKSERPENSSATPCEGRGGARGGRKKKNKAENEPIESNGI